MPKQIHSDAAAAARTQADKQIHGLHRALLAQMKSRKGVAASETALGLSEGYWGKARSRGSMNLRHLLETLSYLEVSAAAFFAEVLADLATGQAERTFLNGDPALPMRELDESIGKEE